VRRIVWPALIGVLSAAFGVAVAELLAAATRPQAGPLVAVGGALIDATPTPIKEFAVRELGTNDKPVLLASIGLVLALFTAVVGILAVRRRVVAIIGAAIFGVAGAAAALARPTSQVYDAVPSLLGAALAGVTLLFLLRRAYPTAAAPSQLGPVEPTVTESAEPAVVEAAVVESAVLEPAVLEPAALAAGSVLPRVPASPSSAASPSSPSALSPPASPSSPPATSPPASLSSAPANVASSPGTDSSLPANMRPTGTRSTETETPDSTVATPDGSFRAFDRRAFLQAAAVVAGGAVIAGGGSELVKRARGGAVAKSREAIRLPLPADPAKPLPAGLGAGFTTPNATFYRVDTALTVPRIDVSTWSLRIHGMVDHGLELSFKDLLNRPLIERDITLNCVSNEVGGPYIGTARWLGVPLAPLLREAGLKPGADQVVARSTEGMTIGTPVQTVLDGRDTMLCVGMNGEPLPLEHGFPVRMLTPGLYGYAGACKWVTEIELTTFAAFDAYWVKRGWGAQGPVKTASRIDKPLPFAQLPTGSTTIAGVAWAQERGIKSVEIRIDDGAWNKAELLPVASVDTWVQWRYPWTPTGGPHTLTVRATDATGAVQTEQRATPFPNGATGWHNITVTAS